jgi:hypothetical protein
MLIPFPPFVSYDEAKDPIPSNSSEIRHRVFSVHTEMVDFGSGQGRRNFETDGEAVVAKRRAA